MTKHTLYGGPCDGMQMGIPMRADADSSITVHRDGEIHFYRFIPNRGLFCHVGTSRPYGSVADAASVGSDLDHRRRVLHWCIVATLFFAAGNLVCILLRFLFP